MPALASQITHQNTCRNLWKKSNCFNKSEYCIHLGVRNDMCQMAFDVDERCCVAGSKLHVIFSEEIFLHIFA